MRKGAVANDFVSVSSSALSAMKDGFGAIDDRKGGLQKCKVTPRDQATVVGNKKSYIQRGLVRKPAPRRTPRVRQGSTRACLTTSFYCPTDGKPEANRKVALSSRYDSSFPSFVRRGARLRGSPCVHLSTIFKSRRSRCDLLHLGN